MESQIGKLESLLKGTSPTCLCHNDLLGPNIIILPREPGSGTRETVRFLDFEYASINGRGLDIANHWSEYAGFNGAYDLYPDRATQTRFCWFYLAAIGGGRAPAESDVAALTNESRPFVLVAHLLWVLWALVQARVSRISFDYRQYARIRINEYWRLHDDLIKEISERRH